jgi:hypothetical protein
MTDANIAEDGSFDIEGASGPVKVQRGFAVFAFNDRVYACPPRQVQETLAGAVGSDNEVVADLATKTEAMREQRSAHRGTAKAKANPLADGYQLKLKPMIGTPPAPQFAPIEALQVDDTYQRSIEGGASRKLIIKIAENWDWRLCLPLLVSRRGGQLFVIDGQHRKEAAELRGDIPHLPVVVFDFDDPKAEAELFVQANRSRRAMGTLDDFHAAVVACDAKATVINEVVTAAGLVVGRNPAWQYWKPGEVVFVSAIQKALNIQGRPVVEQVLGMMARAFEGVVLTGGGALFTGLCQFTAERMKAGNPIDVGLMEAMLAEVGIPGWKEATEGVDSGQERIEAMLKAIQSAYAEAEGEE